MVAGDDGRGVEKERPEVVNAAAHPLAIRPPAVAVAATGRVVADFRSAGDHGAGRNINATAQTIAAITPVAIAANCLVVVEGRVRKG